MKKLIIILSLALFLTACGDENSSASVGPSGEEGVSQNSSAKKVTNSKFDAFMDLEKICDVISIEKIQQAFNTTAEIKISPARRSYGGRFRCNYSWPRKDAEERKQKMLAQMTAQISGNAKKVPMRQKVLDHNFSLSLSDYKGNAKNFIPVKLTEEQLNKRIKSAKEAAAKRLSKKQKAIAGDSANKMIESMIKKSNENEEVFNVGDIAYWEIIASGALNVLVGHTKITVSPMIGDNKKEDIANAMRIVNLISH